MRTVPIKYFELYISKSTKLRADNIILLFKTTQTGWNVMGRKNYSDLGRLNRLMSWKSGQMQNYIIDLAM